MAFVTNHPNFLHYHQWDWLTLLHRAYGYTPLVLGAYADDQSLVGVLPLMRVHGIVKGRRLVGLPFSHDVPILTTHPDAETALLSYAIKETHNGTYKYLELRYATSDERFKTTVLHNNSELDLTPDEDTLFANFSRSNRRNIRIADRADFSFYEGTREADFEAFYRLEVTTRHQQGAPMYPRNFFRWLHQTFPKSVKLYFIRHQGHDIASMIMMHTGRKAIYGYSNNIRDPEIMKLKPQNLLLWKAIQRSKSDGFSIFDFGTTPLHHADLLAFKERYNPATVEHPYSFYLNTSSELPVIQRDGKSVQLVEQVLQRLPRTLFSRLSPFLLREVG